MDTNELKALENSADLKIKINDLINSSASVKYDVNEWLYIYECLLYPKVIVEDSIDFIILDSAISLLKFIQERYPKSSFSFLVQEMNLRISAIQFHGNVEESELLNPDIIINKFLKHSENYTPSSAVEATARAFEALKESRGPEVVSKVRELRGLKNLLGPIESLKNYGATMPQVLHEWLAVRTQLP